jgi:hypothetical protein
MFVLERFCGFGVSVRGRHEAVETWRQIRLPARAGCQCEKRYASDDREYRCRTHPLLVSPHHGQAHRPGPGPGLHVRHAVSADLFDAIGLADRCGGAAGDDRPAQRTDPRLQVQIRMGAISRSIWPTVDRTGARAAARLVDRRHSGHHGHAGGRRLRRSRPLDLVDGRILPGAGDCGRNARSCTRRGSSSGPRSSASRSRCWRSSYGTVSGYRTRRRSRSVGGIRAVRAKRPQTAPVPPLANAVSRKTALTCGAAPAPKGTMPWVVPWLSRRTPDRTEDLFGQAGEINLRSNKTNISAVLIWLIQTGRAEFFEADSS